MNTIFCQHLCLITQNRRWEHTYPQDVFHSTHYLDQLVFLWFCFEQHKWNIERILVSLWYTHHPPTPHTDFLKTFPPFPQEALWRWVVNWEYWRVLIPSLPILPPSNLYRLQCLWSPCSLTFSWEHADCWTSHLEWCWSYCWRNSYKNKKIPFLRNTSVKYSCNP